MSIELKVELTSLARMGELIARFDGEQLQELATGVVNDVADRTYELARSRMNQGTNLTDAYMRDRMTFTRAQVERSPRASILADGDVTSLSHYKPQQLTKAAKPGAKGDPARGVPAGQKVAGYTVEVTRGARKQVRPDTNRIVTLPRPGTGQLILDTEGNPLLFKRIAGAKTRNGKDKFERLLGPAVYQLFKKQTGLIVDEVLDDLETTMAQRADELLDNP